jgi:Carbohydrate binding domain/Regulator of chromosome condensation (RCC1) repeat
MVIRPWSDLWRWLIVGGGRSNGIVDAEGDSLMTNQTSVASAGSHHPRWTTARRFSWPRVTRLAVCALVMLTAVTSGPRAASARSAAPVAVVDPTTVNLVQNGSFETGGTLMTPWIFRHDVAATLTPATGDAVTGNTVAKVHVAATSPSTWLVQLRQENVRLQGANTYTLAFWAKASTPRLINARLQSPIAPYPTFIARDFALTTSWQRFTFEYTAPSDTPNAFVGFNLAQTTGDVEIDHVTLTDNNMVINGGFETPAFAPWTWRNQIDATLTRDTTTKFDGTASAKITVPTMGTSPHHVQLRQPITALAAVTAGERYRISFTVKASRARTATVQLQSGDASYPTAIAANLSITTSWTRISFDWVPRLTVTNPFLGFNLAQDTGTIWLDDITLTHRRDPGTVVGWGDNWIGKATPPVGLAGVIAIAAGSEHGLALKRDGTVVGWGYNDLGQASPPAGLTGVTAIAAGSQFSLALKSDGTVVAWGRNYSGEATPPAGLAGVTAIATGLSHSVALLTDGTVVAWGFVDFGDKNPPAGLTGVTAIAAGNDFSLALRSDGTVVAWGDNQYGKATPPAGLSGVIAIAANFEHSLALKSDGTVVGWGLDECGATTPPAGLTEVTAIATGLKHSLALRSDGTVVGWGCNTYGETTSPVGLTDVIAISAGYFFSLALER